VKHALCRTVDLSYGEVSAYHKHTDAVTGIAVGAHGHHVITVSGDGCMHVWAPPSRLKPVWQPCPAASPLAELPLRAFKVSTDADVDVPSATTSPMKHVALRTTEGAEASSKRASHSSVRASTGAVPGRLSAMSSATSTDTSPMGEHPAFTLHPDFIRDLQIDRLLAQPGTPPRVRMPSGSTDSSCDEAAVAQTPTQRVLAKQCSTQHGRKLPAPSATQHLSMTSIFRVKDQVDLHAAAPASSSEQAFQQKPVRRRDQAWSEKHLALLEQAQEDFKVLCCALCHAAMSVQYHVNQAYCCKPLHAVVSHSEF
jgi:hypothetical protein